VWIAIPLRMDIWRLVGSNVAARRRALGWSQEKFAAKAGISQQYISGLENGRRNPTLRSIGDLARALDIKVVDLFAEIELSGEATPPNRKPGHKPKDK